MANKRITAIKVLMADDGTFTVGPAYTTDGGWDFDERYHSTHCTTHRSVMPAVTRWRRTCDVKRIVLHVYGGKDQVVMEAGLMQYLKIIANAPPKQRDDQ